MDISRAQLLRTPYLRSSQNLSSSHSGGASSTMSHPPKPRHIVQTVNTTGLAYATCATLQQLVARRCRGRGFGIVYCLRTADKAPDTNIGAFLFLRVLQVKQRADERTRTADLLITSLLQDVAARTSVSGDCKCRCLGGFLSILWCCFVHCVPVVLAWLQYWLHLHSWPSLRARDRYFRRRSRDDRA